MDQFLLKDMPQPSPGQQAGAVAQYPGMLTPGNIDLTARPNTANNGGVSTVLSMSVGFDGKHYLIPMVADDGKIMKENEAIDYFKKNGKHLGIFNDPNAATAYAKYLHQMQSKFYGIGQ
jgi:hypothetical protein